MQNPTRRAFLKELGAGTAALSAANEESNQLPGRPTSPDGASITSPGGIMAIAAHPGDAFFTMGAAVALQVQLGARGVFVSLSLGERGSPAVPPDKYGLQQREASARAATLLGARMEFLNYRDGEIPGSEEAKFGVCDLIREYQPVVVMTHWRGSWHKDHQACHAIANDAIFYAGLPAIARKLPPHAPSRFFYAENWEDSEGFVPDTYLDVGPIFDRWAKACAVFPMWRGETGFRYNDYYMSLAVSRGCLSGNKHAVALMSAADQLTRRVRTL